MASTSDVSPTEQEPRASVAERVHRDALALSVAQALVTLAVMGTVVATDLPLFSGLAGERRGGTLIVTFAVRG
jgi:hypothetical protein